MPDDVIDAPLDGGNPSDAPKSEPAAPADGAAPAGAGKSLADGGGGDKPAAAPADWPADWRTRMAGDDKDAMKSLDRYKSPLDVAKALREAQKKISAGPAQPALAKDASPEDVAAYRKQIGVPEKADGYLESLPNGLVIGEADKEIAGSFLETAHAANMPPAFVGAALDWYYKTEEAKVAAAAQSDKEFRVAAEDELRGEFGGDYRMTLNSVKNFLDAAPVVGKDESGADVTLGDMLRGARTPDGRLLGDNPAFLRWMADMASRENPAGFVAPAGSGSQADSVAEEVAKIEKYMRENRAAYNKDAKAQERLRTLYDAQEKLASR